MRKYKVKEVLKIPEEPPPNPHHLEWAAELQEQYGLHNFSFDYIVKQWQHYSKTYCAGWLNPCKESVEHVFCVKLEEDKS